MAMVSEKSVRRRASAPRRSRVPLYRYSSFWITVASIAFGVSTLIAVLQSPRHPYEPLRLDTLGGWLRPIDPGQARALPTITTDLRAVHVDPNDPQKVWVAGKGGTILHSADGGKTWTRQELRASTSITEAPRAAAAGE